MDVKNNIIAIVIAIDHYNGLGVIRSLGECGIPVALILTTIEKSYIEKSKYISEVYHIQPIDGELQSTIKKISMRHSKCFVITTTDFSALELDTMLTSMPSNVVFPSMKGRMVQYQNKDFAKHQAAQAGIRVPKGIIYSFNCPNFKWDIFPAIIKPRASVNGLKSDIQRVDNYCQLQEALKIFKAKGYESVLIEEYIHGENAHMVEIMGYTDGIDVSFGRIIEKIREYPINNGSTAFAKFVCEHEDIDFDTLKRFIIKSGYIGIFDIEFKSVDRKCYFIECNFRNGAPSYALTKIGYNLPVSWISGMSGIKFKSTTKIVSKNLFMCEQTDFLNMIKHNVHTFSWIKDYHNSNRIFVCWSDIKPNIYYMRYILNICIDKFVNTIRRRKEDA